VTAITAGSLLLMRFSFRMKIKGRSEPAHAHFATADPFHNPCYEAPAFFGLPRFRRSGSKLTRSVLFAVAAIGCALLLRSQGWIANPWSMSVPLALCLAAVRDAIASMRVRWDLHHGGVLFLLYADMMLLTLIAVWMIWPA
jgi:hypothetical protein